MEQLSEKEIESYIWLELVNSEKHSEFLSWLMNNFDITQKQVKNLNISDVSNSVCNCNYQKGYGKQANCGHCGGRML